MTTPVLQSTPEVQSSPDARSPFFYSPWAFAPISLAKVIMAGTPHVSASLFTITYPRHDNNILQLGCRPIAIYGVWYGQVVRLLDSHVYALWS